MFKTENQTDTSKGEKPVARIVAYRSRKDGNTDKKSPNAEIGAVWPTEKGNGYRLSFTVTPAELMSGECHLYLFPVRDEQKSE